MKTAALVLAGGQGTRLGAFPKVLRPLWGQTVVEYVGRAAESLNLQRFGSVVSEALKPRYPLKGELYIQDKPQGTGHAAACGLDILRDGEDFLVLLGDNPLLQTEDLEALFACRAENPDSALWILGTVLDDPTGYGRICATNGVVEKIVEERNLGDEKNVSLCWAGVLLFNARWAKTLVRSLTPDALTGEIYLTQSIENARALGLSCTVCVSKTPNMKGVNTAEELSWASDRLQKRFRKRTLGLTAPETVFLSWDTTVEVGAVVEPYVVFGKGVSVASGAVVRSFSYIENTSVGSCARVGPFARLSNSRLEHGAQVGNFVELQRSLLGQNVKAKHLSYVGDAKIGEKTNLGAGTVVCNYDGQNKHATVVGSHVSVGANTSLIAPLELGDRVIIGAGSVVRSGTVPEDTVVVARAAQKTFPRKKECKLSLLQLDEALKNT